MRKEVDTGRQAYVVYPVIEEKEAQAMKAAEKMYRQLSEIVFPGVVSGCCTAGWQRMKRKRDAGRSSRVRSRSWFRQRSSRWAWTFRMPRSWSSNRRSDLGWRSFTSFAGRVGRGGEQSYCMLVTGKLNEAARERIRTLVEST